MEHRLRLAAQWIILAPQHTDLRPSSQALGQISSGAGPQLPGCPWAARTRYSTPAALPTPLTFTVARIGSGSRGRFGRTREWTRIAVTLGCIFTSQGAAFVGDSKNVYRSPSAPASHRSWPPSSVVYSGGWMCRSTWLPHLRSLQPSRLQGDRSGAWRVPPGHGRFSAARRHRSHTRRRVSGQPSSATARRALAGHAVRFWRRSPR